MRNSFLLAIHSFVLLNCVSESKISSRNMRFRFFLLQNSTPPTLFFVIISYYSYDYMKMHTHKALYTLMIYLPLVASVCNACVSKGVFRINLVVRRQS